MFSFSENNNKKICIIHFFVVVLCQIRTYSRLNYVNLVYKLQIFTTLEKKFLHVNY